MVAPAAPEQQEDTKPEIGLEDIPLIELRDLRRWLYRKGPSPALKVDDPDVRDAVYEHLEMLRLAFEDPISFALALSLEVFPQQVTTANAVLTKPKLAIRGCHSSGKTFMMAVVAVWWVLHYEDSSVITTAPTQRQVKRIMWKDIRAVYPMVVERLRIKMPEPDLTQWNITAKNAIEGVATDKTVNFQGFHSQNTLIIMDEAPGLDTDLWGAIEGITASGNVRIVMMGNPTIVSGMFYEASVDREEWHAIRYSALADNPNVRDLPLSEWTREKVPQGLTEDELGRLATLVNCDVDDPLLDQDVTPHMVRRRWIREKWFEWGERDNPDWWGRVMGEFPPEDEMSLIPRDRIDAARVRPLLSLEEATNIEWGADIAGRGQNDTVLIAQQFYDGMLNVLGIWVIPDKDPRAKVIDTITPYLSVSSAIRIDCIGIGYGFFLHMADWIATTPYAHQVDVVGVDVGKSPTDKGKFLNLRIEIFWALRDYFMDKMIRGVSDELLRRELGSLRYEIQEIGSKRKLESKEDMKERGVPSPDRADALALSTCGFYEQHVQEKGTIRTFDPIDIQISPY